MWVVRLGFIIMFTCVCVHAYQKRLGLYVCVCVCRKEKERKKHFGCEGCVRMCVCHIICTYSTVYGSCVCMSPLSLSRLAWMRWEEMRREHCGLGRRSEARLMPVCINAVWHLSAPDTQTVWHAGILWHRVCVCVCYSYSPFGKAHSTWTDFLFALLCHLMHVLIHLRCWQPNFEVSSFSSPCISVCVSFLHLSSRLTVITLVQL